MSRIYLALGLVLIFTGIVGFGHTDGEIEECESLVGEVGQALDEERQQYCDRIQIANYVAIAFIVMGGILSSVELINMASNRSN